LSVVTGATDGIGKEYAIQLARDHRLNVVLISRSMDKLTKSGRLKSVRAKSCVDLIDVLFIVLSSERVMHLWPFRERLILGSLFFISLG
jgi:NAD(P)-dependent dehydrogenase (short-subunit alcohol dehydrogenase family)